MEPTRAHRKPASAAKPVPVLAVKKALDLLEVLLFDVPPGQGIGLGELSSRMGLLPNTTRNLLKTMIVCGFVAQTDGSLYVPGPACLRIGRRSRLATERGGATLLCRLTEFAAATGEACVLAVLAGAERAVLAEVDGGQMVRIDRVVIQRGRLYDTPTGRVLLAHASGDEVHAAVRRHGMPAGDAWEGITSLEEMERALAAIRKEGLCVIERGQVLALGCPVLDEDGGLLGALGCYAPSFRCGAQVRKKIIRQMQLTSAALAKEL